MKSALFAFTEQGAETAEEIARGLHSLEIEATVYLSGRDFKSIYEITAGLFHESGALIFVSACGIAVRAIAPHIKSKALDPAVIVCDELGLHVIPILSGHLGGANRLSLSIAQITGGEAILTTATDIRGVFSVDVWAKDNGLRIRNLGNIKEVSSRLLKGETVGFYSEYPCEGALPKDVVAGELECGIYIGADNEKRPFPVTLSLMPRNLVLGVGCRRATPIDKIENAVKAAGVDPKRVTCLCSIDIKADEPGLLAFAEKHGLKAEFFSAEQLMALEGDFTPSQYVKSVTGADNVCERAATLGGGDGKLTVRKMALDGVTVAVFEKNLILRF